MDTLLSNSQAAVILRWCESADYLPGVADMNRDGRLKYPKYATLPISCTLQPARDSISDQFICSHPATRGRVWDSHGIMYAAGAAQVQCDTLHHSRAYRYRAPMPDAENGMKDPD